MSEATIPIFPIYGLWSMYLGLCVLAATIEPATGAGWLESPLWFAAGATFMCIVRRIHDNEGKG